MLRLFRPSGVQGFLGIGLKSAMKSQSKFLDATCSPILFWALQHEKSFYQLTPGFTVHRLRSARYPGIPDFSTYCKRFGVKLA